MFVGLLILMYVDLLSVILNRERQPTVAGLDRRFVVDILTPGSLFGHWYTTPLFMIGYCERDDPKWYKFQSHVTQKLGKISKIRPDQI